MTSRRHDPRPVPDLWAGAVVFHPLRSPRPGEPDRPVCLGSSPPPDDETRS